MKKCILIGALAALMLFAFTACDNQVQTFRIVDTISLVQSSAVVEGTAADASDFTVTLVYTDGTSAQVSGVGYVTVTGDKATASVTNAYGRKIESAPVSVEKSVVTSVEFSGVESISVVTGTTISKMDDVTIEADEDNFAIAFAYDGGSEVLPLSETVFALYDSNGNLVTKAGAVGEVYDVYLVDRYQIGTNSEVAIEGKIPTNVTVTVVAQPKVTSITAEAVKTIYFGDDADAAANYKVTANTGATVNSSDYKIIAVSGVDSTGKFNTTEATTIYFQMTAKGYENVTYALTVEPQDYITDIRVADPNRDAVTAVAHDGAVAPTLGVSSGVANHLEVKMASNPNAWVTEGITDYYFSVPVLNAYSSIAPTQQVNVLLDNEKGEQKSYQLTYNLNRVE